MNELLVQSPPTDLKTLLWILLVGSTTVIAYLFHRWEKCKTECEKEKDLIRKEERDRYDKLAIDFSNYKDKTIDEKIESSEKFLVVITNFQNEIKEMPNKIVERSLGSCRKNMESYINQLKNERGA